MVFRSERALLKALRRQDPRALEAAIIEYGGYVMAVALHTLGSSGSRQDAEEVASDVFVVLWERAALLAPDSRLKAWLAVVARNASIKVLRSLTREPRLDGQAVIEACAMDADDSQEAQVTSYGAEPSALSEALGTLDADDRDLLNRRYGEEQSIEDIAQATGLSKPAVKSRLYRRRKALRDRLRPNDAKGSQASS
ncbi:MAG: sigma-70 family RNA polymerase sigma factor [Coriobacteriales bacterium]|jgi:RNA polymerase sigma-70 factor (ECF subfamily)|nr:sigma-70 family RNA polymerase sigma factor [Coriobacteriales bacterium]